MTKLVGRRSPAGVHAVTGPWPKRQKLPGHRKAEPLEHETGPEGRYRQLVREFIGIVQGQT